MRQQNNQRTITIIGYGSQGRAWAANFREAGYLVTVMLPARSRSHALAHHNGFLTTTLADRYFKDEHFALLIPDREQASFLHRFEPYLPKGATLLFADGYCMTFDQPALRPDLNVGLINPLVNGLEVRRAFQMGGSLAMALAIWQNPTGNAFRRVSRLAQDLAAGRADIVYSTFQEACFANLFFEQTLACGAIPALIDATQQEMLKRGVNPKLAQRYCEQSPQQMFEMISRFGVDGMLARVSEVARVGGERAGRFLIDTTVKRRLARIFDDIVGGNFDTYLRERLGSRPLIATADELLTQPQTPESQTYTIEQPHG